MGVVADAVGAKSRQIAVALQLFGNAVTTTSTSGKTPAVTESIAADARDTWERHLGVLQENPEGVGAEHLRCHDYSGRIPVLAGSGSLEGCLRREIAACARPQRSQDL